MTENEILAKAGNTLTDEIFPIKKHIAPVSGFHKLRQKLKLSPTEKVFRVRQVNMGSLFRISTLLLEIDMKVYEENGVLDANYTAIRDYGPKVVEIVAIALNNSKSRPTNEELRFITDNFSATDIQRVIGVVFSQMRVTDFMSSIILMKGMNILEKKDASVQNAKPAEVSH